MKCSVCQRELAPTLSMCIRCGAMRNDSVREEVEATLAPISGRLAAPIVKKADAELRERIEDAACETKAAAEIALPIDLDKPATDELPFTVISTPALVALSTAPVAAAPAQPILLELEDADHDFLTMEDQPLLPADPEPEILAAEHAPVAVEAEEERPDPIRSLTSELPSKDTSQTLADFVSRNSVMPDWRLQLQNSIRQRTGRDEIKPETRPEPVHAEPASRRRSAAAHALKLQYEERNAAPAETPAEHDSASEDRIARAMRRIEESRRTYLPSEKAREGIRAAKEAVRRHPFSVVSRSDELADPQPRPAVKEPASAVRPKLISSLRADEKYDTAKLVPIPEAAIEASSLRVQEPAVEPPTRPARPNPAIERRPRVIFDDTPPEAAAAASPALAAASPAVAGPVAQAAAASVAMPVAEPAVEPAATPNEIPDAQGDDMDDLAPISSRVNAALFDLIAGGLVTFVLLSPYFALAEHWFSFSGVLLFVSVLMLVMMAYLTASIHFLGRSFGMRLFGLDLVDVETGDELTLNQAAANSGVYLVSLLIFGAGSIPVFLNEERRALHDLIAGTIMIREL